MPLRHALWLCRKDTTNASVIRAPLYRTVRRSAAWPRPPAARRGRVDSHRDDELSPHAARVEVADRVRHLRQRADPLDDRRDCARLDQIPERVEVFAVLAGDERPEALSHEG